MRNISFTATKPQFRAHQKHVTRRGNTNGPTWKNLKPGDVLMGCEQCQGLGKGGKIVKMGAIIILDATPEPINEIIRRPTRALNPCTLTPVWWSDETTMEGFPELTPVQFVDMLCDMNDCEPETEFNRVLFDYVDVKP
jgi:hypothetical protein